MAPTASAELRDAVTHALEQQGVLARMRAELRLSVFQSLDSTQASKTGTALISGRSNAKRDALLETGARRLDWLRLTAYS